MSFRFVAVRIHAEGRNLQGSRIVHGCTNCSCGTEKAACKNKAEEGQVIRNPFMHMYTHQMKL